MIDGGSLRSDHSEYGVEVAQSRVRRKGNFTAGRFLMFSVFMFFMFFNPMS